MLVEDQAGDRPVRRMNSPKDPRSAPRRKQLKTGIVAFNGRHSTLPCRVREISDTGARIEVENAHVPDTFELIIELDGVEADCAVVWRRGIVIGVQFTAPPRLRAPKRIQVVSPTKPTEKPSLRKKPIK